MTDIEMWTKSGLQGEYESWSFGGDSDNLAKLVKEGVKTATTSLYDLYSQDEEPLPKEGEYNIILDSDDNAVCIIKTTKVYLTPFNQVTKEHAYKEGEGDKSIDYWKSVHKDFFSNELKEYNMQFSDDMIVVCEEFEVVFKD